MPEVKIIIEVDDKGTVKVKQFSDQSKKSFDEMKKGSDQTAEALKSLRDNFLGVAAKIGIAIGTFYTAKRMIYDTAVQIASATNEIERQAKVLGIGIDEFQKWTYAAKMSDVNAQELALGLKLLSRNMEDASSGSGDAAKYFSAMGISVKTTEGHLRPLNDVMGDIMDKFSTWEDGPRKIAIAMQLFGRSGEALIPLLNRGSSGFAELAREAQKLGIILSPDLVRKGGEAEDAFKRIAAQWERLKMSFIPAAKAIAESLEPVLAIVNLISAGIEKIKEFSDRIEKWKYKVGIGSVEYEKKLSEAEITRESAEYYRNKTIPVGKPPLIEDKKKEIDTIKDYMSALESVTAAEEERGIVALARHQLEEEGWSKEKDIVEQVREELARFEREANEWGEVVVARQELIEAGWKKAAEELKKSGQMLDEMGKTFGDTLISNMVALASATEDWGEKFKSVGTSILQTIMQIIAKQLIMNALFENSS